MCSLRKVTKFDCLIIARLIVYPFVVCLGEVGEYFFCLLLTLS